MRPQLCIYFSLAKLTTLRKRTLKRKNFLLAFLELAKKEPL